MSHHYRLYYRTQGPVCGFHYPFTLFLTLVLFSPPFHSFSFHPPSLSVTHRRKVAIISAAFPFNVLLLNLANVSPSSPSSPPSAFATPPPPAPAAFLAFRAAAASALFASFSALSTALWLSICVEEDEEDEEEEEEEEEGKKGEEGGGGKRKRG